MKKQKCNVCGCRFTVEKKLVYMVTESISMVQCFSSVAKKFDAIDCPHCGCQHILKERMDEVKINEKRIEAV